MDENKLMLSVLTLCACGICALFSAGMLAEMRDLENDLKAIKTELRVLARSAEIEDVQTREIPAQAVPVKKCEEENI